jgi:hypothetical protein
VSLSASKREQIPPIVFDELSTGEQEIVQTALEAGEYTTEHASACQHLSAFEAASNSERGMEKRWKHTSDGTAPTIGSDLRTATTLSHTPITESVTVFDTGFPIWL